jgi:hypothetical protein
MRKTKVKYNWVWSTWEVYYKKNWWNRYRLVYESNKWSNIELARKKALGGEFD